MCEREIRASSSLQKQRERGGEWGGERDENEVDKQAKEQSEINKSNEFRKVENEAGIEIYREKNRDLKKYMPINNFNKKKI